ncbi:hypothetical protein ACNOYE_06625 [Nannocystaceae bacterium ST9]
MTTTKTLNLWMASTTLERDALGSEDGVALGDFCLLDGVNLYTATAVLAAASTWRPIAGLPTIGPFGLGAKNTADTANRAVFVLTAIGFRAVLDTAPSSVTITASSQLDWPTLPTVSSVTDVGFVLSGTSASVAANADAWIRGTYTITY